MALIDNLKYAIDTVLPIPYHLGLRPYQVFLTKIVFQGSRPGLGTRTRTDTEMLIGDGYPVVRQVSAHDIFASGGLLNDKDFKMVFVDPYNTGTHSGGIDPSIWNPQMNVDGYSTQIYFHIYGKGFPVDGQYFKKKYGKEDCNLVTELYLEAVAEKPGL